MHEMTIAQEICRIPRERVGVDARHRMVAIGVEIGDVSGIEPKAGVWTGMKALAKGGDMTPHPRFFPSSTLMGKEWRRFVRATARGKRPTG